MLFMKHCQRKSSAVCHALLLLLLLLVLYGDRKKSPFDVIRRPGEHRKYFVLSTFNALSSMLMIFPPTTSNTVYCSLTMNNILSFKLVRSGVWRRCSQIRSNYGYNFKRSKMPTCRFRVILHSSLYQKIHLLLWYDAWIVKEWAD